MDNAFTSTALYPAFTIAKSFPEGTMDTPAMHKVDVTDESLEKVNVKGKEPE